MSIANNRKAFHDYFIEEQIQAGLVLEGWEVKAIRAGRVQLKESYIYWKKDALYLVGWHNHRPAHPASHTHQTRPCSCAKTAAQSTRNQQVNWKSGTFWLHDCAA